MATEGMTRRPIGQILVDGGFLERRELEIALEEQQHTNELLGQVLVRLGVLEKSDVDAALSIQNHLATVDDAVKSAAGIRRLLGSLLLMTGRLTTEQLDFALAEQKVTGEKLGDILVRLGLLTESQIGSVLAFQQNQEDHERPASPLRLGEVLISSGYITRHQLDDALQKQSVSRKRLGEVLVEEGYAHLHQVNRGLHLQQKLMRAVLVAVVSLAGLSMQGCGSGDMGSDVGNDIGNEVVGTSQSPYVAESAKANPKFFNTNYLQIVKSDYNFKEQPTFYYSTDNQSFWSLQANIAKSVTDINSRTVLRLDIQKTKTKLPPLNKTFSIEDGGLHVKFPGVFSVFDGQQTTRKKVEHGTITFSHNSVMSKHVSGSFTVIMTDYDSAVIPAPQYEIRGVFSFKMGEYGPAV